MMKNLDWNAIKELGSIIRLWKRQGKTIVISEHRLWYLKNIVDRAVYMEDGSIVKVWSGKEFSALPEKELAGYELRPITLEEQFIRQFSGDSGEEEISVPEESNRESLKLRDFYFTYTPPKHLFFRKKLKSTDADICTLRIPTLDIKKNAIVGIIGSNGSGKSTFLRCLCGLEKTCTGTVTDGAAIYKGKALTKECHMVMQDVNHQLFTDSVLAEVLLSMEKEDEARADEILRSLDLYQYRDKHPMSLSGGQKQRVAIASAIASDARLLLFDEPTSGLDYRHMKEVAGLLKTLAGMGKTVLVSTHDPELVSECCDSIIRISKGRAVRA